MESCVTDGVISGMVQYLPLLWILLWPLHTMSLLLLSPVYPACFASHARTVVTQSAIRFGRPREEGRKMSAYARLGPSSVGRMVTGGRSRMMIKITINIID